MDFKTLASFLGAAGHGGGVSTDVAIKRHAASSTKTVYYPSSLQTNKRIELSLFLDEDLSFECSSDPLCLHVRVGLFVFIGLLPVTPAMGELKKKSAENERQRFKRAPLRSGDPHSLHWTSDSCRFLDHTSPGACEHSQL